MISLEESLGLPPPPKQKKPIVPGPEPVEGQIQVREQKTAELKILTRRIRVFELRCQGLKIAGICEKLREERIEVSERTVWEDLHSPQAQELIDELTRQQLEDIANLKKPGSRLHWRDILLEKLLPRKVSDRVEVNVNASASSNATSTASVLAEYDALIAKEMGTEKGSLQKDHSGEQVHSAQAADSS